MAEQGRTEKRGRQAEGRRNDLRVLDAAREVFAEQGTDASVAVIAERAGVGVGSLYRRYPSKQVLLERLCVLAMEQAIEAADAALELEDGWAGLASYIRACVGFNSGSLVVLAGTVETTPEMWALSKRSRQRVRTLVERAKRGGGLRDDVNEFDIAWLIERFGGSRGRAADDEDENVRRRLVAIALDGLRTPAPQPLPGAAPTAAHYGRRWSR